MIISLELAFSNALVIMFAEWQIIWRKLLLNSAVALFSWCLYIEHIIYMPCITTYNKLNMTAYPYKRNCIQIPFKYHWFLNGFWMVFEWYLNGTWMVLGGIMAKGIWLVSEWFLNDILNSILDSLYRSVVSNGILNYRLGYHWVMLKYHWYWMVFNGNQWYSIGSFL